MSLELAAMHVVHRALRRELELIAGVTVRIDEDPRHVLRTAPGWERFKQTLRAHQRAEDDLLWPELRRQLADQPDEAVVLEALEAEHAAIDQLITMIDELLDEPEADPLRLGDLTDSLVTGLAGHLTHEEATAIPLIERVLPAAQWAAFERAHEVER
ncbi:hemerythrin domain-containing protein [Phytohabitans aurantiacus]|nr:hemerythrin domain-containing protein [Phytohabitans aurantiacus]